MHWTFGRTLALFTALGFAMVATQVSLFHYRGNFRNWTMWGPVISAPIAALLLLWYGLYPAAGLRAFTTWFLWVELFAGFGGFGMHVRGVTQRLGGWGLNNVLTGPPVVLPLTLSAFSVLGLMALHVQL